MTDYEQFLLIFPLGFPDPHSRSVIFKERFTKDSGGPPGGLLQPPYIHEPEFSPAFLCLLAMQVAYALQELACHLSSISAMRIDTQLAANSLNPCSSITTITINRVLAGLLEWIYG